MMGAETGSLAYQNIGSYLMRSEYFLVVSLVVSLKLEQVNIFLVENLENEGMVRAG